jgi:hypothetical protein
LLDNSQVKVSLWTYDVAVNTPYSILKHYDCDDNTKRKKLGVLMGRQPLLNHRNHDFVRNVLARQDRANEGLNVQEAIDLVQELDPKLSQQQARFHLSHTLLKGNNSIVKPKQLWHNRPPQNAAS